MGLDMLAQDYLLKQITASLVSPENELGKNFWQRVYHRAYDQYGTTDVPFDTFHKVWILPEKAVVYEGSDRVFVVESSLKVLTEQDYFALKESRKNNAKKITGNYLETISKARKDFDSSLSLSESSAHDEHSDISSKVMSDIIIPELQREVNTGKHFAVLRQIYFSLILAYWYKNNLRDSILNQVYSDQAKVSGLKFEKGGSSDLDANLTSAEMIYNQYLKAFQKGVCNIIKVEYDPHSQKNIPRKYFSGGFNLVFRDITYKRIDTLDAANQGDFAAAVSGNKVFFVSSDVIADTRGQATADSDYAMTTSREKVVNHLKQLIGKDIFFTDGNDYSLGLIVEEKGSKAECVFYLDDLEQDPIFSFDVIFKNEYYFIDNIKFPPENLSNDFIALQIFLHIKNVIKTPIMIKGNLSFLLHPGMIVYDEATGLYKVKKDARSFYYLYFEDDSQKGNPGEHFVEGSQAMSFREFIQRIYLGRTKEDLRIFEDIALVWDEHRSIYNIQRMVDFEALKRLLEHYDFSSGLIRNLVQSGVEDFKEHIEVINRRVLQNNEFYFTASLKPKDNAMNVDSSDEALFAADKSRYDFLMRSIKGRPGTRPYQAKLSEYRELYRDYLENEELFKKLIGKEYVLESFNQDPSGLIRLAIAVMNDPDFIMSIKDLQVSLSTESVGRALVSNSQEILSAVRDFTKNKEKRSRLISLLKEYLSEHSDSLLESFAVKPGSFFNGLRILAKDDEDQERAHLLIATKLLKSFFNDDQSYTSIVEHFSSLALMITLVYRQSENFWQLNNNILAPGQLANEMSNDFRRSIEKLRDILSRWDDLEYHGFFDPDINENLDLDFLSSVAKNLPLNPDDADFAQIASAVIPISLVLPSTDNQFLTPTGGIDFDRQNFNIETLGQRRFFDSLEISDIELLNDAKGFIPVIINIIPVVNYNMLMGLQQQGSDSSINLSFHDYSF